MLACLTASGTTRIDGFDVARAFAILGMVLVHFALTLAEDEWRYTALAPLLDLLDGRAAATFLVLAGVGIALRTARAQHDPAALANVRRSVCRRGLFLLGAGFLLLPIWPGDILRVYGVTMLLAAWLLRAHSVWLWAVIAIAIAGFIVLFALLDYEQNWIWESMTYRGLWSVQGQVRNLFYDGFRSVFPWSAFFVFGMWLGRLDWSNHRTARNCLLVGGITAILVEFLSRLWVASKPGDLDSETAVALYGTLSMPPLPVFLLAASATAMAVIAASVLLAATFPMHRWLRALVATGQLAFTWYIGHIVVVVGLHLVAAGSQALWIALLVGSGFFAAAAAFSLAYKQRFKLGPLEWLLRTVAG